jgi:hypothetical protein
MQPLERDEYFGMVGRVDSNTIVSYREPESSVLSSNRYMDARRLLAPVGSDLSVGEEVSQQRSPSSRRLARADRSDTVSPEVANMQSSFAVAPEDLAGD